MSKYYQSPRWNGDILNRSMPITFDHYNKCSFNCLYCLSFFQKSHSPSKGKERKDYQKEPLRAVNPTTIDKMMRLGYEEKNPDQAGLWQFNDMIKNKITMQWGGLADPFCHYERKVGVGLQLLEDTFKPLDYPLAFCTKGTWWRKDDRYLKLFKGQKNWLMRVSISNLDPVMALKIDKGCESPEKRFQALKLYNKLCPGNGALRLRPFILGMSDKNNEYLEMIKMAKDAGCKMVAMGFFCVECRADDRLLERYNKLGDVLGYNIYDHYKNQSIGSGYRRLTPSIKQPYMQKAADLCKKLNMHFYVSDPHCKDLTHNYNFSGLPEHWFKKDMYFKGSFAYAMSLAKREGKVYFKDIKKYLQTYKKFRWRYAEGFNTGGTIQRTRRNEQTMFDYFRERWNKPNDKRSPYKYYLGLFYPVSKDKNGDIVYEYRGNRK